jgi:catechol 2,3-dioxygenase
MPRAKLGHAHLLVRDVERSTEFYTSILGLRVTEQAPERWAFLTSGDLHHELALSQLGPDAPGPEEHRVGLFHLAFDVDSKTAFAEVVKRLIERRVEVRPVDHRIGWGAYFCDPDGNGLEVYCDTRGEPDGAPLWEGRNRPLTVEQVLEHLRVTSEETTRNPLNGSLAV